MEGDRTGHSIKKLSMNNKGVSLVSAILIALFALFALAGLYFALTKLLGSSQTIKTYASIRDAAAGGVNYAVMVINSKSELKWKDPLTNKVKSEPSPGDCLAKHLELRFRLSETSGVFDNQIYICFVGYQTPPGSPFHGVPNKNIGFDIYTIISIAKGPQDTRSRIEAVYAKPEIRQ